MPRLEITHVCRDGVTVHRRLWTPTTPPRAVVVLVHGLGEHSGRYDHLARRFTGRGIAVLAQDSRGHGRTPGGRGVMDFDASVGDVGELIAEAHERFPEAPVVIYGHSLGALVSMTYTIRHHPESVVAQVASAPALDSELRDQRLKLALANVLGRLVPSLVIPSGLDSTHVSRDPEVVAAYQNDPLVHDKGSVGLARSTFAAMDEMMAQTTFPVPLLILHGTGDRLTVPEASKRFVDNATGDITLIEYDGMYHEPHNEPEQQEVFEHVMDWLEPYLTD
jgi:alpha-beta hydrolase superfamily lysophospholipase